MDVRVGAVTPVNNIGGASVFSGGYNRVTVGTVDDTGIYLVAGFSNGTVNVQDGKWHYVAVTYNDEIVNLYVDGILDSQSPFYSYFGGTIEPWASLANITIGCDEGPANGWAGGIQDVAFYTNVLTASQIANHYNTGMWFQTQEYGASVGTSAAGRFNKVLR